MSKLLAAIVAAMFALGTVSVFAADAKKEEKKADAPKAEAKKADAPKAEAKKADAPKSDAPKK